MVYIRRACFLLISLLLMTSSFIGAQEKWTTYTTSDGLPGGRIQYIGAAPDGTIWVGTSLGAVRFDGINWKTFTTADGLAGNNVSFIAFGPDGTVWFSTKGDGISKYHDNTWITMVPKPDGVSSKWILTIAVAPDNAVYAGASDGLLKYDESTWERLTRNEITRIAIAADGTAWESMAGTDFWRSPIIPLAINIGGSAWFARYVAFTDMLDVRWLGNGVSLYNGASWEDHSGNAGLTNTEVSSAAVDSHGVVWFGTMKGLVRFDGSTWKTFTITDGLPDNTIYALAIGGNGTLWIGTDKGVSYSRDILTSVGKNDHPGVTRIKRLHPNPFNASATINFEIGTSGKATLTVYSVTGQKIRELVSDYWSAGMHSVVWDGRNDRGEPVSSGVYLSRLVSGGQNDSAKMLLMK